MIQNHNPSKYNLKQAKLICGAGAVNQKINRFVIIRISALT